MHALNLSMCTPRANQAILLAERLSLELNHKYLGSEHLLLAILKLGQGVAYEILFSAGLNFDKVFEFVKKQPPFEWNQTYKDYTPRFKKMEKIAHSKLMETPFACH